MAEETPNSEEGAAKFCLKSSTDPVRVRQWKERQNANFLDFEIHVDDARIPCHKLILSAQSDYFCCMFQHKACVEVSRGHVVLHDLSAHAVNLVVDFLYSGHIECDANETEDVIKVASHLQLTDNILLDSISKFVVSQLSADNCIGWWKLAEQLNLEKIKTEAKAVMSERFSHVTKSAEFLSLSFEDTTSYVKSVLDSHINQDQCLRAFISWIEHDDKQRLHKLEEILTVIDLKQCSTSYLNKLYIEHGKQWFHSLDLLHQFTAALSKSISMSKNTIMVIGGIKLEAGGKRAKELNELWFMDLEENSKKRIRVPNVNWLGYMTLSCEAPGGFICVDCKDNLPTGHMYNTALQSWLDVLDVPSGPIDCRYCNIVCVHSKLLLVGGAKSEAVKRTACCDLRTMQWSQCADLLYGLSLPVLVALGNCVYAIGRPTSMAAGKKCIVQCYDVTTDRWAMKAPLPPHIDAYGACAVSVCGQLYVVGGRRVCCRYNPHTDTWTVLASPLLSRFKGAALAINGRILLSGGYLFQGVQDCTTFDSMELYDPETDTWRLLHTKLNTPKSYHSMVMA